LTLGASFSQILQELSPSIKYLTFDDNFNKRIDHIPLSVTHLVFGKKFNQASFVQTLGSLHRSKMTHLTFGNNFNQPIMRCIPNSVTYLRFGDNFNQPISLSLWSSVTHLHFGKYFNQSLADIPHSIRELTLCNDYNQKINNCAFSKNQIIII
jgi:hypothetical protein